MLSEELFQSSLGKETDGFLPKQNGFVDTVIQAYNNHHELVIRWDSEFACDLREFKLEMSFHYRPDDIWIAILSQLNL